MMPATPRTPTHPPGPEALPQALVAYALLCGLRDLDAHTLRRLDTIALVTVQALPKDLSPTDATLDRTMHDLRHAIAQEQTRRAQAWARIAAQLTGLETDPDQDQEIDQDQPDPQETDADRAAKLLRAALLLIMQPPQGPNGNGGGGGRPVRPIRPGPTTPPIDGRALSLPTAPVTSRRGDDDIPF